MKEKQDLLCQGEVVPQTWKDEDGKSIQLQAGRGTVSILAAVTCGTNTGCFCPRQSTQRDARSERMTLGCVECPRSG